eukprot:2150909-Pyramimonas_sp.AAC.1
MSTRAFLITRALTAAWNPKSKALVSKVKMPSSKYLQGPTTRYSSGPPKAACGAPQEPLVNVVKLIEIVELVV